jgi:hypothetical protein
MSKDETNSSRSKPITFRVSAKELKSIESRAAACLMTRSDYVRMTCMMQEPPRTPALAALAQVIAIRELVTAAPSKCLIHLPQLDEAVRMLCSAAHAEIDQL